MAAAVAIVACALVMGKAFGTGEVSCFLRGGVASDVTECDKGTHVRKGDLRQSLFSSRWRTHEPLVSSQEIFLRIRSLDQEFPRGVARARHARARVTCATEHPGSLA